MTYAELLARASKLQDDCEEWKRLAMGWKKVAADRDEIIKQYQEIVEKALTRR